MVHCLKTFYGFFPAPVHYTGPPPSVDSFHISLSLSLYLSLFLVSRNTHTTRSPFIKYFSLFCHPVQYNIIYTIATKYAMNSDNSVINII